MLWAVLVWNEEQCCLAFAWKRVFDVILLVIARVASDQIETSRLCGSLEQNFPSLHVAGHDMMI